MCFFLLSREMSSWTSPEMVCLSFGLKQCVWQLFAEFVRTILETTSSISKNRNTLLGTSISCRCLLDVSCQQGPSSSAVRLPMAYGHGRPWALAELTRHRPFVNTGRLVVIRRKLPTDQVAVVCGEAFLLFWNGGSIEMQAFFGPNFANPSQLELADSWVFPIFPWVILHQPWVFWENPWVFWGFSLSLGVSGRI